MLRPRVLVLYGTTDGQTRKVACELSLTFRSMQVDVDLVNAREQLDPKPEDYDAIFVAASIRAGGYQREVRRWVKAHAAGLAKRPAAFVSVCLGILEKNPKTDAVLAGIVQGFAKETGWQPPVVKFVAGALPYTKYNWFLRRIMRRIVARAGGDTDIRRDYEYTDWKDLEAFAREFASSQLHLTTKPSHALAS
jgi:menaquinone-dependent protoporphyrinogen oxidase